MWDKLLNIGSADYLSAFGTLLGVYELVNPKVQNKVKVWLSEIFTLKNVLKTIGINLGVALIIGIVF